MLNDVDKFIYKYKNFSSIHHQWRSIKMKNKLLKKAGYLITAVGLGSTLLFGNVYAEDKNPTEITIRAHNEEYTKTIRENQPLQLSVGETLKLNVTAYDEDGIDSHYAFVESKKFPPVEVYSNGVGIKSSDEKSSNIDMNVYWFTRDKVQVKIVVKDKQGNTTRKTLDVYFE